MDRRSCSGQLRENGLNGREQEALLVSPRRDDAARMVCYCGVPAVTDAGVCAHIRYPVLRNPAAIRVRHGAGWRDRRGRVGGRSHEGPLGVARRVAVVQMVRVSCDT